MMLGYKEINIVITNKKKKDNLNVLLNGLASHTITSDMVTKVRDMYDEQLWKSNRDFAIELGKNLFDVLNGPDNNLQQFIREARTDTPNLVLNLNVPPEFDTLPFEMMYNSGFLAVKRNINIVRKVNNTNNGKVVTPQKRQLRILFMACSPINMLPVLDYEKEEDTFFRQTSELPVEIHVEDSGTLEGLADSLENSPFVDEEQMEKVPYDVIHLSGHAVVDKKMGPLFCMENEFGELHHVTPHYLWKTIKDYHPRLLFLSGCQTGQYADKSGLKSFAEAMVTMGSSCVLAWSLPVSDIGATRVAGELYKALGGGTTIADALQRAREELKDIFHVWPILRLFKDGNSFVPLIEAGHAATAHIAREENYRYFEDAQVDILVTGFVGRRRELQQSISVLKKKDDKYGLLITGTAGVGKSTLAGRIIQRVQHNNFVVIHGEVIEQNIERELKKLFIKESVEKGLELLKGNIKYDKKIKGIFSEVLTHFPVIFYFDDFEKNLVRQGDGEWKVSEEYLKAVAPFIADINLCKGKSHTIITSRYTFIMEESGENRVKSNLKWITLMSFRDANLMKLKRGDTLPFIAKSKYRELYIEASGGNPRILEWFNEVAEVEGKYSTYNELKSVVNEKLEKFKAQYLIDIITGIKNREFLRFLKEAAIYRIPITEEAFTAVGNSDLLNVGVATTLFEKEVISVKNIKYWLNPIIRDEQFAQLDKKERQDINSKAFAWYDEELTHREKPDYKYMEEVVYHALKCRKVKEACFYAVVLDEYYRNMVMYEENLNILLTVASQIDDTVIKKAIKKKDSNPAAVFNNLGFVYDTLGEYTKAIEFYNKSIDIDIAAYGASHPDVAVHYNNLGVAWKNWGEYKKAIEFFDKALDIDIAAYGDKHPDVAIRYSNLGAAWKNLCKFEKAIKFYNKALEINIAVYGDKHPDIAREYNNLGGAWNSLGKYKKAIEFYTKALDIDITAYGDKHPNIGIDYNNLGAAWNNLGKYKKAIIYYDKSLYILKEVYGKYHPSIATSYNNIGGTWYKLGKYEKAIEFYDNALNIDIEVYGDKHPAVAREYNNLGTVWNSLCEYEKAIEFFDKALNIDIEAYGDKHPDVAGDYNNLGSSWSSLGDSKKAIEFFDKALDIDIVAYGDKHPAIAGDYNNLGAAWNCLGKYKKAIEFYTKALDIDIAVYGDKHPDVAGDYNNLGSSWSSLGDSKKAVEFFNKVLDIYIVAYGDKHPDVAICYNNLGTAWYSLGEYEKAIEFYSKALDTWKDIYSENETFIAGRYKNLGLAWYASGNISKAIECFNRAIVIFITLFGPDHPNTKSVQQSIDYLKGSQ